MTSPRSILVAVAWPYASGSRHIGHLAGAYLPADIFARYHRAAGNRVLMVSGSDVHGTPITFRADQEGVSPQEIVDRFHGEFVSQWEALGISWDLYTSTGTPNHHAVTQDMFLKLLEAGYIDKRATKQFYDPEAQRFLPDRYLEGTCPHCGYDHARGDQCDNCGRTLDPIDLIEPRSTISKATPEQRETEHFYIRLSEFRTPLADWLNTRRGWRKHVLNFSLGWIEEGLRDRAITRDIDWGVDIPVDDLGPGKKIYVWFDAVIGYLSASKEWASLQGTPEAWREWWEDPEAESYYFIGKDNIPFHTIIWPAMLMGYGGLNLPTDVPANQYVTFKGGKASASRGIGLTIGGALERFEPDALRYALAATLPEQQDTDLTEDQMLRRINDELVATWGNLAHRVVSMIHRYFSGTVPAPGPLDDRDRRLLAAIDEDIGAAGRHIEAVELKAGLASGMRAAGEVNAYLNATEPWKTAARDESRTAATLYVAANAVAGINVALAPYLPFTASDLHRRLGLEGDVTSMGWKRPELPAGTRLGPPAPLFSKVEVES